MLFLKVCGAENKPSRFFTLRLRVPEEKFRLGVTSVRSRTVRDQPLAYTSLDGLAGGLRG